MGKVMGAVMGKLKGKQRRFNIISGQELNK